MGMRRNIALYYGRDPKQRNWDLPKIYFYTHWGALDLEDDLRQALIRGESRWNDPAYLARIIFSEMIRHDVMDVTGFGIDVAELGAEYPTIKVDLKNCTVDGVPFAEFIASTSPYDVSPKKFPIT
jgi:hypothetical protein